MATHAAATSPFELLKAQQEIIQMQLVQIFRLRSWAVAWTALLVVAMISQKNAGYLIGGIVVIGILLSELRTSEYVDLYNKREREFRRMLADTLDDAAASAALKESVQTKPWQGRKMTYLCIAVSLLITAIAVMAGWI